ncbi:KTSC domain-containing protein [Pedobacter sp. Leaf250]|uniref:KTSC domain-containing protein n=1 Tax=Pedobacter sp. Leaf250 TaxID=2876559 RepID=UPI001E60AA59|nr:KTSC domain-containing protein [Pedobacter sp. Leaf250]
MLSSVIHHYSYNPDTKSLKIAFVSGLVYQYKNVPKRIFKGLTEATSKGQYFNTFIKDHYSFSKVEDA